MVKNKQPLVKFLNLMGFKGYVQCRGLLHSYVNIMRFMKGVGTQSKTIGEKNAETESPASCPSQQAIILLSPEKGLVGKSRTKANTLILLIVFFPVIAIYVKWL